MHRLVCCLSILLFGLLHSAALLANPLVYEGKEGAGTGKHIVFIASDHEYRSEETLPALARILAKHHGFKCTVLFGVDENGVIKPGNSNVPGMEALQDADLLVIFTRFQNWPDDQMEHFVNYLKRGGPIVGLRTATHGFRIPKESKYTKYSNGYRGAEYKDGFGRQILGEKWAGHYGGNHRSSTRLDIVPEKKNHPILRGVKEMWVQCGGYFANPLEPSEVLAMAQPLLGMEPDAKADPKRKPVPGAWVRSYKGEKGNDARVFTSTYGASNDIENEGYRRLLINACFWTVGLAEKIEPDLNVAFVGKYNATWRRDRGTRRAGLKPQDLAGWTLPIVPLEEKGAKQNSNKLSQKKNKPKNKPENKSATKAKPKVKSESSAKLESTTNLTPVLFLAEKTNIPLQLTKGDHICLVGNALGERMQHQNAWETGLYQRFPQHQLVVRNLCFPADEPFHRMRSLNFGSPDDHLKHSQANVILFFFGFNESFQGKKGLDSFTKDLTKLIQETKTKAYDEKTPPRMVLVSPIAFENTGDVNLPDGKEHNHRLELYTDAMKKVAANQEVGFVDLFRPTLKLFAESKESLTLNGAHLNATGYRKLAPIFLKGLFGDPAGSRELTINENSALKREIDDKNFHWWHRYRAVNGYSIYGKRGTAGSDGTYRNREVMERERAILDQMCANRDQRIWALAQEKSVAEKVDDSNTLPFITPKTNVGGKNDPNRKRGKLGSLDYSPAEEQQKKFNLAKGYVIDIVATEADFPELANPVALNFDNQGRLWVATMPSYPQWKPKTKMDDKLVILEDTDGDGRCDTCKTFAGGLHQPTGFELGSGGVYVAQQPDILFLKDTNGDDQEDIRIRKLIGFDTADSHHGISAFEWGPGGALYFEEGTFKQSQVESPYGPARLADAGVWRYEPRSEKFGVHVSLAFANPWGHVFDRWGENFVADASPGFNYWAAPISGRVIYPHKHPGGCRDKHRDFVTIKNPIVFPTFIKKRVRPTSGCEIVSSRNFPPEAQGNFLVNNVIGFRGILQHTVHDDGSGFGGEEIEPLLTCDDGNFRPVDMQFGPDGALYIVDWHNALIGHLQHNLRDPSRDHSHGRIWRVRYKNRPLLTPPKIADAPVNTLLELLKVPEDRTRYRVRRELSARETKDVIPDLKKWIAELDSSDAEYEHNLLEGLWMYQSHNVVEEELLKRLLNGKRHEVRAAAVRVLSYWLDRIENPLVLLNARISDDHPRVRLEAVRACSFLDSEEAIEAALEVLNHDMDKWLQYTLDETMKTLETATGQ